MLRSKRPTQLC